MAFLYAISILFVLIQQSSSFTYSPLQQTRQSQFSTTRPVEKIHNQQHDYFLQKRHLSAALDPNSLIHTIGDIQISASTLVSTATPAVTDYTEYNCDVETTRHLFESLMSTIYSTGVAHGHSNPWFGPPDPYLEAGKSIAPTFKAAAAVTSDPALTTTTTSATSTVPNLPKAVQDMISKGYQVIDASSIKDESYLPGFVPTAKTFSTRESTALAPQYLATFLAKAEWASTFVNVLDKLALASFAYVLVEFFYLRPNVDLYKSEIDQESPASLWADVLATFTVRFAAMSCIALLTLAMFQ